MGFRVSGSGLRVKGLGLRAGHWALYNTLGAHVVVPGLIVGQCQGLWCVGVPESWRLGAQSAFFSLRVEVRTPRF